MNTQARQLAHFETARERGIPPQADGATPFRMRAVNQGARCFAFAGQKIKHAVDPCNVLHSGVARRAFGAIGDINLLLTRESVADSDLLVIAGDNLFRESLAGFIDYAWKTEATVGVHHVTDGQAIKKYGVVTVDADGVITHFEEKPKEPKSSLAAIALYFYSKKALPLFTTYIAAGNNPDQPGLFLQWLYPRKPVNTFQITGQWLDIGSKETLEEANRIFAER